jgi:hypothetical protein
LTTSKRQGEGEPKTVQGILRHAKTQTAFDLHTQDDSHEALAAQSEYLTALRSGYAYSAVNYGRDGGFGFVGQHPLTY